MTVTLRFACCLVLLLLGANPGLARAKRHKNTHAGSAGRFDYYLLALSWSPEFCHSHAENAQCSKHLGFIVHGLWPEYTSGRGPQYCSTTPGLKNPEQMLDIMPDLHLIAHEWTTHGTCSGLDPETYFGKLRKAFESIRIPAQFQKPAQQLTVSPGQVAQAFSQANLKLPVSSVAVTCPGNYLSGVEICLDKNLNAMACTTPSPCKAKSIRVPPVN